MPESGLPRSYADIAKLTGPDAYKQVLAYLSWHNRLPMTNMLDVWEALVLGFACESKVLDSFYFNAIKSFFAEQVEGKPETVEACRSLSKKLIQFIDQ